jgi:hypothetical protein
MPIAYMCLDGRRDEGGRGMGEGGEEGLEGLELGVQQEQ